MVSIRGGVATFSAFSTCWGDRGAMQKTWEMRGEDGTGHTPLRLQKPFRKPTFNADTHIVLVWRSPVKVISVARSMDRVTMTFRRA